MLIHASWRSLPFIFYDAFQSSVGSVMILVMIGIALLPDGLLPESSQIELGIKLIAGSVLLYDIYLRKKTFQITLSPSRFDYARRGLLDSEYLNLPREDIDSIALKRTVLCRLLGLSKVEVKLASADNSPIETLYLPKHLAQHVEIWSEDERVDTDEELNTPQDTLVQFSFSRIWLSSLTRPWREQAKHFSMVAILVGISLFTFIKTGSIEQAANATTDMVSQGSDATQSIDLLKAENLQEKVTSLSFHANLQLKFAAFTLLIGLFGRFVQSFWKEFGYQICPKDDGILIRWGLFDHHAEQIKRKNISHYDVIPDLLYRAGWVRLRIFNRYESGPVFSFPLMRKAEAQRVIAALRLPALPDKLSSLPVDAPGIRIAHLLPEIWARLVLLILLAAILPLYDSDATPKALLVISLLFWLDALFYFSPKLLRVLRAQVVMHDTHAQAHHWEHCPRVAIFSTQAIAARYYTHWRNECCTTYWVGKYGFNGYTRTE